MQKVGTIACPCNPRLRDTEGRNRLGWAVCGLEAQVTWISFLLSAEQPHLTELLRHIKSERMEAGMVAHTFNPRI